MGSSERVLSGRACRPQVDPWNGAARPWSQPVADSQPIALDPLADAEVMARIAEATRQAADQGYAEGRRAGEQELAAAIASAQGLARSLETAVPRDVEMVARTVAELAVLIARRILAAELRHDPAVLVAAIEAGLRQAAGASVITVELHPSAVDAVEAAWTARHGARHRGFSWSFTADPTMPVGGCRLRSEHGFVEAGFEDQLAEVAAALDASIPGYLTSALGPTPDRTIEASETGPVQPPAQPMDDAGAALLADGLDAAMAAADELSIEDLASLGLDGDGPA